MARNMTDLIRQTRYKLANRMIGIIGFAFLSSLLVDLGVFVYIAVQTSHIGVLEPNPVTLMLVGFLLSEVRNAMSGHQRAQEEEDKNDMLVKTVAAKVPGGQ